MSDLVALRAQSTPHQLPYRRRPAGHALGKSEVVDRDQLVGVQHDLQSLAPGQNIALGGRFRHLRAPR